MASVLYTPPPHKIESSNLTDFINFASQETGKQFTDYDSLHAWSISENKEFWSLIWKHSNIIFSQKYTSVLDGENIREAKWFSGAKLNFAENLLRRRDNGIAIIYEAEKKQAQKITYAQLYAQVASCAEGLKKIGVGKGDRVAGILTNSVEPVIAMLASASLGAIWSSCSPDFGTEAIHQRFSQINPKVLFAVEGYYYNSKYYDCKNKIKEVLDNITSIENLVLVTEGGVSDHPFSYKTFDSLLDNPVKSIDFEPLEFDHPLYILFSSGTTGKPKCIVHGAGGTLLQHYKELALHSNLKSGDVLTYFTTCGWMMWNWMVSALFIGSTLYVYDGSPAEPNLYRLWKAVEEHGINVFGTSPGFLSACQKKNIHPPEKANLSSLNTILSTGSPLSEENFKWVYTQVKSNVQLSSISGGTDILSCFVLGNPNLPVMCGKIQCIGLGMDVKVFDENEKSIEGKLGELVCTGPFPSRPIMFWNDSDGRKYKDAYFKKNKDVWYHGDFIKITTSEGITIAGRSDTTLNHGGVRIGTAEIYNIVEKIPGLTESLICDRVVADCSQLILFVKTETVGLLDENIIAKIKMQLKLQASPRHVPQYIFEVPDIPKTMSGKKMELLVKKIMQGEALDNKEVVANSQVLESYFKISANLKVELGTDT